MCVHFLDVVSHIFFNLDANKSMKVHKNCIIKRIVMKKDCKKHKNYR